MANGNHKKIQCNFRAGKIFLTLKSTSQQEKEKKNSHTILLSFFLCLERQAMLSHPWAFVLPQCLADCRLETSVYLKVPKTMRCWPQTNVESGQGLKGKTAELELWNNSHDWRPTLQKAWSAQDSWSEKPQVAGGTHQETPAEMGVWRRGSRRTSPPGTAF